MLRLSKDCCSIVCDIDDNSYVKRAVQYFNKRVTLSGVGYLPCLKVTGRVDKLTDSVLVHILTVTHTVCKSDERFVADIFVRLTGSTAELCVSRMRGMRRESKVVKYFTWGRPSDFKEVMHSAGVTIAY